MVDVEFAKGEADHGDCRWFGADLSGVQGQMGIWEQWQSYIGFAPPVWHNAIIIVGSSTLEQGTQLHPQFFGFAPPVWHNAVIIVTMNNISLLRCVDRNY